MPRCAQAQQHPGPGASSEAAAGHPAAPSAAPPLAPLPAQPLLRTSPTAANAAQRPDLPLPPSSPPGAAMQPPEPAAAAAPDQAIPPAAAAGAGGAAAGRGSAPGEARSGAAGHGSSSAPSALHTGSGVPASGAEEAAAQGAPERLAEHASATAPQAVLLDAEPAAATGPPEQPQQMDVDAAQAPHAGPPDCLGTTADTPSTEAATGMGSMHRPPANSSSLNASEALTPGAVPGQHAAAHALQRSPCEGIAAALAVEAPAAMAVNPEQQASVASGVGHAPASVSAEAQDTAMELVEEGLGVPRRAEPAGQAPSGPGAALVACAGCGRRRHAACVPEQARPQVRAAPAPATGAGAGNALCTCCFLRRRLIVSTPCFVWVRDAEDFLIATGAARQVYTPSVSSPIPTHGVRLDERAHKSLKLSCPAS